MPIAIQLILGALSLLELLKQRTTTCVLEVVYADTVTLPMLTPVDPLHNTGITIGFPNEKGIELKWSSWILYEDCSLE